MKKRIFVGMQIPNYLASKINRFSESNFDKYPFARIIKKDNLHVTLVPPWHSVNWEKEAQRVGMIAERHSPFEIEFEKVELGPKRKKRLVWAVGRVSEKEKNLQKDLLDAMGKSVKDESFFHLTMVRFKLKKLNKFGHFNFRKAINWKLSVGEIALFESKLSPKGADYSVLKVIKLGKDV